MNTHEVERTDGDPMQPLHETLHFSQDIQAPVDVVWRAYADLDQRLSWGAPAGAGIAYDDHDLSPGGVDRYRCGPPEDLVFAGEDRYLHVEPGVGFVSSGTVHRDGVLLSVAVVTWQLHDLGHAGTRVTLTDQLTSLVGREMIDGHREGHGQTLARLAEFCAART